MVIIKKVHRWKQVSENLQIEEERIVVMEEELVRLMAVVKRKDEPLALGRPVTPDTKTSESATLP